MPDILTLESKKKIISLSNDEILKSHTKSIFNEASKIFVKLSDLEFADQSIIKYRQKEIQINPVAYKEILNSCKLNLDLDKSLISVFKDKDRKIKMINSLKTEFIKNNGDKNILLLGNKTNHSIINAIEYRNQNKFLNNQEFLDVAYKTISEYDFQIVDFLVDDIGKTIINVVANYDPFITDLKINNKIYGDINDEIFYKGFSFVNNLTDYSIYPTMIRIKCTNQLSSIVSDEIIRINGSNDLMIKNIFNSMDQYKSQKFLSNNFLKQFKKAYITPASFREFENINNYILNHSSLTLDDLNKYTDYSEVINTFNDYKEKNNLTFTQKMKSMMPTNQTIWKLINSLTDIASNS